MNLYAPYAAKYLTQDKLPVFLVNFIFIEVLMRKIVFPLICSALILSGCVTTGAVTPNSTSKLIANRYLDHGDGTVTDTQTHLMWKKCSEGLSGADCSIGKPTDFAWTEAMSKFAKAPSFAAHNDWRLPTIEELRTLIQCSNGTPLEVALKTSCGRDSHSINIEAFPRTWVSYWSSSTTDFNPEGVWNVSFYVGTDDWTTVRSNNPVSNRYKLSVRLVRSGK